ncbi:MAG: carbohydrate ABC transporter permease [Clostridiales bacterium]|jgi:multiple sugar transport system permease protein|nr:carbohydrate ABC transporter permease [Clostridiales bacterium]
MKKARTLPVKVFLALVALVYIAPILIIMTNSFMKPGEIARNYGDQYDAFDYTMEGKTHYAEYHLIPEVVSAEQYLALFFTTPEYLDMFVNSLRLTLPIVLLQIVTGTAAAYGFTVWKFRFKEIIFCVYIILMLLPFQTTLVSNYIIADRLKILNTHLSIILPWGFSPFAAFIMRQSMKGIPYSFFEAAQIDGANQWRKFIHIAVPLSAGGLASLVILVFTDCWAMVEQPLIFLRDANLEPLSVFLSQIGREEIGLIFAASVFYMTPAVWIFLYGQEYFEQGIKLSAIK